MKKIISTLLGIILLFMFVSCNGQEDGIGNDPGTGNGNNSGDDIEGPELVVFDDSTKLFAPNSFKDITGSYGTTQLLKEPHADLNQHVGGNGHTQTWDGKLFFITRGKFFSAGEIPEYIKFLPSPCSNGGNYHFIGWMMKVFRPENVKVKSSGAALLNSEKEWLDFSTAFSDGRFLETDYVNNHVEINGCDMTQYKKEGYKKTFQEKGHADFNPIGVTPNPDFPVNPFPSNSEGELDTRGSYRTYEMYIYTQNHVGALGLSSSELISLVGTDDAYLGIKRAQVVVRNPDTPTAEIHSAKVYGKLTPLKTAGNKYLKGLEPTVTMDGRVVIWQGHADNDGKIDYIMYSYNRNRNATTGWSEPKPITRMYEDKNAFIEEVSGNTVTLGDIAPISRKRIRNSFGDILSGNLDFQGAYPWIDFDGANLLLTTVRSHDGAIRGGQAIVGDMTQNILTLLDSRVNMNRAGESDGSLRLFTSSPGFSPGMWDPYRDHNTIVPVSRNKPVLPIYSSNSHNYSEVNFEDFMEGSYIAYYRFNEVLDTDRTGLITDQIVDTSGYFNNGTFTSGVGFPQEARNKNELVGVRGQAVIFDHSGRIDIDIQNESPLVDELENMTVEFFIKPLADLSDASRNNYRLIFNKPDSFNFILEESGDVNGTIYTNNGQVYRTGFMGVVPRNKWSHVAMSFDSEKGELKGYINGVEVKKINTPKGIAIRDANREFYIGNSGLNSNSGSELYILDEFKISNVVRSIDDIKESAFILRSYSEEMDPDNRLPLGLKKKDLHSSLKLNQSLVDLGHMLFFDERLSSSGEVSCSTCHDPRFAFTDRLVKSEGINEDTPRNSQAAINRAFGSYQFFDGRSSSVEKQALQVVNNENELGRSLADSLDDVTSFNAYYSKFQQAFGRNQFKEEDILTAIGEFQKSILLGNSRVDRYENGDFLALSDEEKSGREIFRGKARCIACHSGSNYSDGQFHTLGFFNDDEGRSKVTGREMDKFAFKTPTLRDISRTAPYMHNGEVETLDDVIDLYNDGIALSGITNQDFEIRPLGLTLKEKRALKKFLQALGSLELNPISEPSTIP